ncbi:DUF2397 family protein [Streptomyces sp. bgisy027]|uniref:DUF2397 family protein n=1 Tax=Streptomyces sp. bgisy027 TaxID=3413770 RepID=UPI003D72F0D4
MTFADHPERADRPADRRVGGQGPGGRAAAAGGGAGGGRCRPGRGRGRRGRAYAQRTGRWAGLSACFVSVDGRESRARLPRGRVLGAIPQLLAAVRQLDERRGGELRPVRRPPHPGPLVCRSPGRRGTAPAVPSSPALRRLASGGRLACCPLDGELSKG